MDDKAGAIEEPHDHDLICGRGGKVNAHPGNRRFRSWVNDRKEAYTRAQAKGEKNAIAQSILEALFSQNPPGRVLQFDEKNGMYTEVSFKKAMSKTTQALREGEFTTCMDRGHELSSNNFCDRNCIFLQSRVSRIKVGIQFKSYKVWPYPFI